jgi:tripartite-type tricarboxylate transporter receptor subunit TctC
MDTARARGWHRRVTGWRATAAMLAALAALTCQAQTYPQRTIRLIVPFAAGGTTDAIGRVLAAGLSERLGQPVVVENRGGAGGTLGAEVAARSGPDGYTLLLGSVETFGMTYADAKRLAYNPEQDLAPVALVARAPNAFVVHGAVRAATLAELIEFARANPGKLRYGSPGIGTNVHIIGELFKRRFGLDMPHVPYKGGGAAINDVASGQIEVLIGGVASVAPRARAGQVRALAVTGAARTPLLPDAPTMAEAGVSDFVLGPVFGVLVPGGTPGEVVGRLERDTVAATGQAEFRRRLVDVGAEEVEPLTGAAFGAYMRAEARRWRELAAAAGMQE